MTKKTVKPSKEITSHLARLSEQKTRHELINYHTGFQDGVAAIKHGSFLLFDSAVNSINDSPEYFIQAAEENGFSIVEYTAAKLSGIEDLSAFDDLYGVTNAFYSAITQRTGGEYPPEKYVEDFVYGINSAINEIFRELEESGLDLYEA